MLAPKCTAIVYRFGDKAKIMIIFENLRFLLFSHFVIFTPRFSSNFLTYKFSIKFNIVITIIVCWNYDIVSCADAHFSFSI